MHKGNIWLHRRVVDWGWYTDANTVRLFFHLILTVNYKDKCWKGIDVKRGSKVTGRKELSLSLALSEQQIRTSLNKLISTSNITIKTTNKFSVVTVNNYDMYQSDNQQSNQQVTNKQPTSNQQVTTTKTVNKEIKKTFIPPTLSELTIYMNEVAKESSINLSSKEPDNFMGYYEEREWKISQGKMGMKDWRLSAKRWIKNNSTGGSFAPIEKKKEPVGSAYKMLV